MIKKCPFLNGLEVFSGFFGKTFDTASEMLKMRVSLG